MLCNHLILCRPLLLPHSIFPSIRVSSNELALRIRWPKYWSFTFSISPSNEYSGLISLRIDWFDLLGVRGESSPAAQFKSNNSSAFSLLHGSTLTTIHDYWKCWLKIKHTHTQAGTPIWKKKDVVSYTSVSFTQACICGWDGSQCKAFSEAPRAVCSVPCYHTSETAGPKLEGLECLLPQFHHGLGPCCSPRKLMRGKESSWWTPASQTSPSDRSTCQLHLESTGDLLSHSGHTQQQGTLGNTVTGAPHTVSNGWIGLNNRITLRHMLWKAEITFNMFNLLLRKKQRCQVPEMFDHFYSCNNFPCLNRASPFIKHLFLYLFFSSFIECVGGSFSVDFQIWASVIS